MTTPGDSSQPPSPSLPPAPTRARIVRGSVWTLVGYFASQVLRLAGNIILARLLLDPTYFGLMALVNVLLLGLEMLSDLGVGQSLIQNPRGDEPAFRNTAWTLQVLRGVALALVAGLAAWPLAKFYDEPLLAAMLPVAAVSALIAGFYSTSLHTARRHLRLERLQVVELSAQAFGLVVMCVWAATSPSVWALVAGVIATAAARAILSHAINDGPPNRFAWKADAVRELLGFGKWVFFSTFVTFCGSNADRLVLGKLVSASRLGLYSVALGIATLPIALLGQLAGSVMLPVLSQTARTAPAMLGERLRLAREALLAVGLVLVLGVATEADLFFEMLYKPQFHDSGRIAQLLTPWVWIAVLTTTADQALIALGNPRSLAVANLCKFLATLAASLSGFWLAGLEGFIAGLAIGAGAGYLVVTAALAQHGLSIWRQDLRFSAVLGVLVALAEAARFAAERFGPPGIWHRVVVETVTLAVLTGVGIWALVRLRRLVGVHPREGFEP